AIPKGHHEEKTGFFGWFNRVFGRSTDAYEGWVARSLKRGGRMLFIYLGLAVVMGFLYLRLPSAFLPQEDQGYVISNIELPSGSTANRTIELIEQVEGYFMQQPEVANIITVQGFSFNGSGLNAAIAFVTLKDFAERKGAEHSAEAIANKAIGSLLFGLPDSMTFTIVPPAISELGNASGFDLRLQDRASSGHDALMGATQQLLALAAE